MGKIASVCTEKSKYFEEISFIIDNDQKKSLSQKRNHH